MMYSRLGGCLWETTKLGLLVSIDLWALVKGLLDKLITHLGLGSSSELLLMEPWGLLALIACLLAWRNWGEQCYLPGSYCCLLGQRCWLHGHQCFLPGEGHWLPGYQHSQPACLRGNCAISLWVSAGCLCTTCLWGNSTISLEDSVNCLGRGTGCLGISTLCSGTTCLRRRGAGWTRTLCLGTTCMRRNSTIFLGGSADCLRTTCLRGRVTGCLGISAPCPRTAYLHGGNSTKPSYISFFKE